MLVKDQIGRRVVIRRRLPDQHLTDVVGVLRALGEMDLIVATDKGEVTIRYADIVAAKEVPPRPVKYSEIAALERAAVGGWPPVETAALGDWVLRAGGGWTNRANTALPIGDPCVSLEEGVATVVSWYKERGLQPRFAVPLPLARGVARVLEAQGWESYFPTTVMVSDLSFAAEDSDVVLADEPDEAWLRMMAGQKGELPPIARSILTGPEMVTFASLYCGGELAAIGRCAVADGWAGFALVQTSLPYRGQGLARKVMGALAAWARAAGAGRGYLQVEEANEPAISLYTRLGFARHHGYVHYRLTD